jgi:hypothetical protein
VLDLDGQIHRLVFIELDASGGVWDLGVLLLSLSPLLLLVSLRVAHTVHSPDMIIL